MQLMVGLLFSRKPLGQCATQALMLSLSWMTCSRNSCAQMPKGIFCCGAAAEYAAEGVEPQREAMHVQRCEGPVCTGPYKGSTPSPMLFTWFPTSCWLPFFFGMCILYTPCWG